jgi:hydrogenase maturation protein HypF
MFTGFWYHSLLCDLLISPCIYFIIAFFKDTNQLPGKWQFYMNDDLKEPQSVQRYRILFKGIVQGVGFRPYLYRSAKTYNLNGFVKNTSQGVILEVEGLDLDAFVTYTMAHLPPLSEVVHHSVEKIPIQKSTTFEIHASESTDKSDLLVSPDIAVCDNCKKELLDPNDRRYRYPFINCTDCGPRLTIIRDLPYDRPLTTMKKFPMCEPCGREYQDPLDRRYHAQPVACADCGPMLFFTDNHDPNFTAEDPLLETCKRLISGQIAAIKGLGGYHLACLGSSDEAVKELRARKKRKRKPFALMGTLDMIRQHCDINEDEARHLKAPAAPILLLKRKKNPTDSDGISHLVAPGQDTIGFMLPYTPLHILLLHEIGEPLLMTSANFSDEPIMYKDDHPALKELADIVLFHDRDIHLFADDSVARVVNTDMYMIRRSRGYVPYPITMPFATDDHILGLGPMLKTTFTMWRGDKALASPYIGTTDSPSAVEAQWFAIEHYMKLFSFTPSIVVMDKHPGYPNRLLAQRFHDVNVVEVQHHRAHIGALLAEKGHLEPIIGVSFDGTGYGDDGKIWGGEFFTGDYKQLNRFGHLKNIFLPAGDKSVKEPWRFALSLLFDLYGDNNKTLGFCENIAKKVELPPLQQLEIIKKRIGGVETSSAGRIFDAASVLLGIGLNNYFDGDLPSQLQTLAQQAKPHQTVYSYALEKGDQGTILNLLPAFDDMLSDHSSLPERAYRFHHTLAAGIVAMTQLARQSLGINTVGLTGGVFQNTLLLTLTMTLLQKNNFDVLIHNIVPSTDGGISIGQVFLAHAMSV